MIAKWILLAVVPSLVASLSIAAQQTGDPDYEPKLERRAVVAQSPAVAVDAAHRNFHILGDRYAPFGKLLEADGYRVAALNRAFTADALAGVDVLVIANARAEAGAASAFSPDEVAAVKAWVEAGGSLLLIADHAPFGAAAAPLAAAFGVEMGDGYVVTRQGRTATSQIAMSGADLGSHAILAGGSRDERVRKVQVLTGQSLSVPAGASALLILPGDALEVADLEQVKRLRDGQPAVGTRVGGRAMAVALNAGKGRVVIAGEAAMLTEQRLYTNKRVGLSQFDNERFALNMLHWLSRHID